MQIVHISGYRFLPLSNLSQLQSQLFEQCQQLKGTILLGTEGINLNLAGDKSHIEQFKRVFLTTIVNDIFFKETPCTTLPYKRLKIKIKNEIVTMRQPSLEPPFKPAANIDPETLKAWLDQEQDFTLLDTRNDYEVKFGSFVNAVNLKLNDFCEFPAASQTLDKQKPIVMFCTGGIRCEKASVYLLSQGFENVYQLEGGILNYFQKTEGEHFQGDCFVFDDRIALNKNLQVSGTKQCKVCFGPVSVCEQQSTDFIPGLACPACVI